MYIRKTKTKTLDDGEAYFTCRLVESVREGQQVKQRTLLNLGKDFAIEPQHWPLLTDRIEQLLQDAESQQVELLALADEVGVLLETAAQCISRLIVHKLAQPVEPSSADYQRVDINRVDAVESRCIGAEILAWHAACQLQLAEKLKALGFNGVDRRPPWAVSSPVWCRLAANCTRISGCSSAPRWVMTSDGNNGVQRVKLL